MIYVHSLEHKEVEVFISNLYLIFQEILTLTYISEQATFAKEFASGFLVGEVLNKYQLQDDFDQFSQSK